MSHHDHSHSHSHVHFRTSRALFIALLLNSAFVVVEGVAGWKADSLALLSDAGHNFTDVFALILAAFGVYWQGRPGDHKKTFGYQRAGVLAAFVNSLALVLLSGYFIYESIVRLLHPEPVAEGLMMIVATIGVGVNLGTVFALGGGGGHHDSDLNVRAAWLHMAGDAAASVAIIIGAAVMRWTGWHAIDPLLSLLIAVGIIWSGWGIVRDTINILLEGLPKGLRLSDVTQSLMQVSGVIDVHDLHIWSLGADSSALSCHVLIEDMPPSASDAILRSINHVLAGKFHIFHTTIQFEHVRCVLADVHCSSAKLGAAHDESHQH